MSPSNCFFRLGTCNTIIYIESEKLKQLFLTYLIAKMQFALNMIESQDYLEGASQRYFVRA